MKKRAKCRPFPWRGRLNYGETNWKGGLKVENRGKEVRRKIRPTVDIRGRSFPVKKNKARELVGRKRGNCGATTG